MVKADRTAYKVFVVGDKGSISLSRVVPDLLEHAITNIQTPLNYPTGIYLNYVSCINCFPCIR